MDEQDIPYVASAVHSLDRAVATHWLDFGGRVDAPTFVYLKQCGWRYSGLRAAFYKRGLLSEMPKLIKITEGAEVNYSADRAERLEERAGKHSANADSHFAAADRVTERFTMGQPILIGHHSEASARRDADRGYNAMSKAIAAQNYAQELAQRAEASAAHQQHVQSAPVVKRRLDKLEADLRRYEKYVRNWHKIKENPMLESQLESLSPEGAERYMVPLRKEIEIQRKTLEDLGGIPADHVTIERGDLIIIDCWRAYVLKVNKKTIKFMIASGGAKGDELTCDKSKFRSIIRKHNEAAEDAHNA